MITKEQQKDLILLEPHEMRSGIVFYRKEADGNFSTCIHSEFDAQYLKPLTEQFFKEKRLFRRKNKPFNSFA